MTELTSKQQRFVDEYLIDLNGTQAAIRTGYSPKTATVQASRLLTNANISAAIAAGKQRLAEKTGITQERVLKELGRIAFLDIRKAFDEEGRLLDVHSMDDDTAAAISGLEVEANYEGRGESREIVGRLHKVKLSDKKGALDSLARHLGMFVDKTELTGPAGAPAVFTLAISGNAKAD